MLTAMSDDLNDASLSVVAHNLRGAIGLAVGATRTVRMRWAMLDEVRRDELLQMAERGMARVDDAVFGIARGLPAEVIADLQRTFDVAEDARPAPPFGRFPVADNELDRLAALQRYDLLDQPPADDLDAIVRLAAQVAGSSGAAINLIDADRQWQAATFGWERGEMPREQAMCSFAMFEGGTVNIPDSSVDPLFVNHPYVNGDLGSVKLYAGVPLVAPVDHVVGMICVFDDEVRILEPHQISALEDLARILTSLFEERALAADLRRSALWQNELIQDLERERRRNEHLLDRLGSSGASEPLA